MHHDDVQSCPACKFHEVLLYNFVRAGVGAYKEADETDFWLNLLHDNGYLDDKQYDSLKHDMDRILKILTSIVKTMNSKVKGK